MLIHRAVTITVSRIDQTTIRANFVPKRLNDSENEALTTPLTFTGTPEELDTDMAAHLASYVDASLALGSTLAEAKALLDAAAKAAKEEADLKARARRTATPNAKSNGPVVKPEPNLFDTEVHDATEANDEETEQQGVKQA
jgi:PRTRC genetic system protein E